MLLGSMEVQQGIWQNEWLQMDYGPYQQFTDPETRIRDFYLMQKYDPAVGAVLTVTTQKLLSRIGEYEHPEERIQTAVRAMLESMHGWSRRILRGVLTSLWAGFSISQVYWDTTATTWTPVGLQTLHPMTFVSPRPYYEPSIEFDNKTGEPSVFRQWDSHGNPTLLDPSTILYWPYLRALREDVYGQSLLERVRRAWYTKTALERFWSVWLEKGVYPTPVVEVPPGNILDEGSGKELSKVEFYQRFFEKQTVGQALVVEAGEGEKPTVNLLETSPGVGDAFELAIKYWEGQTFMGMVYPRLLLAEPEHASRAQAMTMAAEHLLLLTATSEELGEVLVDGLAKRYITYNFGEQESYGAWTWQPFDTPDLLELAEIFQRLTSQFMVPITPQDQDKIRRVFGDIFVDPAELKAVIPPAPSDPGQVGQPGVPLTPSAGLTETPGNLPTALAQELSVRYGGLRVG
jgi:hypothetical protein